MQLTGRCFITVAGKRLGSKEKAKMGYGNPERKGVTGDTGVLGYQENTTVPFIECVIPHKYDVSLKDLAAIKDATISFSTDTGRSYVFTNAWCAKSLELDGGDVSLRFEAMACEEN
jgi:hypothetical protein